VHAWSMAGSASDSMLENMANNSVSEPKLLVSALSLNSQDAGKITGSRASGEKGRTDTYAA
jgi:hypothetical protein